MTTLNQRIAALQQQRGNAVSSYEAALQPSLNENRELGIRVSNPAIIAGLLKIFSGDFAAATPF